jgi:hypothetical protein
MFVSQTSRRCYRVSFYFSLPRPCIITLILICCHPLAPSPIRSKFITFLQPTPRYPSPCLPSPPVFYTILFPHLFIGRVASISPDPILKNVEAETENRISQGILSTPPISSIMQAVQLSLSLSESHALACSTSFSLLPFCVSTLRCCADSVHEGNAMVYSVNGRPQSVTLCAWSRGPCRRRWRAWGDEMRTVLRIYTSFI